MNSRHSLDCQGSWLDETISSTASRTVLSLNFMSFERKGAPGGKCIFKIRDIVRPLYFVTWRKKNKKVNAKNKKKNLDGLLLFDQKQTKQTCTAATQQLTKSQSLLVGEGLITIVVVMNNIRLQKPKPLFTHTVLCTTNQTGWPPPEHRN